MFVFCLLMPVTKEVMENVLPIPESVFPLFTNNDRVKVVVEVQIPYT